MVQKLVWPVTVLVVVGALLCFGYFVWPGQWQYSAYARGPQLRTHRVTGQVENYETGKGWIPIAEYQRNRDAAAEAYRRGLYQPAPLTRDGETVDEAADRLVQKALKGR